jgi:uracil-DNA glycosylase family 4
MTDHATGNTIDLKRALLQQLDSWRAAGVETLPTPGELPDFESAVAEEPSQSLPSTPTEQPMPAKKTPPPTDSLPLDVPLADLPNLSIAERKESLESLAAEVAACQRCSELVAHRTQTVFGVGNPRPRLCFFGEAPGADEDRRGEPFVGRAGQLLNKMIAAMGIAREDVYILNVLKCRPPGNRDPQPEESASCRHFFERQFEILRPDFICCLGRPAMMNLLETKQALGRMRGRFHNYRGAKVVVTYHPAYLLRNPPAKKQAWEDLQMLMDAMGLEDPREKDGG